MTTKKKNVHAVALGKLGAKKGGKKRWENVSPEARTALMREAVRTRWKRWRAKMEGVDGGVQSA